ncbi:ATP-dependent helicase [Acidithiobacillus ferrooxidans]|uniref:ATP-dependent helicase n=1 Tax=Acidithiobacillus ferrooxidans TaxID=920 RepID=UPI000B1C91F7|nr:ATP-dependent helicase [Acidithiobacillus ferrooxidans]
MLTEEQQAVVHHQDGHALVCAVPGSGKSTTMQHLAAHLIEKVRVPANEILVLMFNKDAETAFKHRMQQISARAKPEIRTFHAKAYHLLTEMARREWLESWELEADHGGFYWRGQAKKALARAFSKPEWDLSQEEIDAFTGYMTIWKAFTCTPEQAGSPEGLMRVGLADDDEDSGQWVSAYRFFELERERNGKRSFDDLVYDLVLAMRHEPRIRESIANRYRVLIVDEFQDVNDGQMELLTVLAGNRAQVIAVGDDDQSIYGFRGASPDYMTREFAKVFPGATTYTLSHTFRFGRQLSMAAAELIVRNQNRITKTCQSADQTPETQVHLHFSANYGQRTAMVLDAALRENRQVAVLVRVFHQTALVEIHCASRGIPYRIEGAAPFYQRRDVQSLLGFLAWGAADDAGGIFAGTPDIAGKIFRAMLGFPSRFLTRHRLDQAEQHAQEGGNPQPWISGLAQRLARSTDQKEQRTATQMRNLLNDLAWVRQWTARNTPAGKLLRTLVVHLDLAGVLKKITSADNAADQMALFSALADYADQTRMTALDFVRHIQSLAAKGEMGAGDIDYESAPRPLITSWHRTKGLEFDTVIIPDLSEGKSPYIRGDKGITPEGVEEERRLLYVAMTRAIHQVHLITPDDRGLLYKIKGITEEPDIDQERVASPFFYEIDRWKGARLHYDRTMLPNRMPRSERSEKSPYFG